uniref:Uncharacterized protein n=1 Tax=Oryza sativa subsp. japonica TaxID=39947 RepID=Q8LIR9_ORYSJ|nr:hypothetical protein [Oryza sativa Japonica Group]BAD31198.1 hypothetical protein [Oryza sativa Japonica Group]
MDAGSASCRRSLLGPCAACVRPRRAWPRLTRAGRQEGEEAALAGHRMGREEGEERAGMGGGGGGEGDGSEERRGRLLRRLRPVVAERIGNKDYILCVILVTVGNTNRE